MRFGAGARFLVAVSACVLVGCGAQKRPLAPPAAAPRASAPAPGEDPAILTARELFPGAFGLKEGPRALSGSIGSALYVPLTESFPHLPAVECLNLLGQPGHAGFVGISSDQGNDAQGRAFTVIVPMVFRDRRAGYVLGVPSGARGLLFYGDEPGDADEDGVPDPPEIDPSKGFFLDRLVIIEPDGRFSQGRASVELGGDGIALVCPADDKRRAAECRDGDEPADQSVPDPLPYRYEVTRCAPGCEALCPNGITELMDCSHPPPAACDGNSVSLFFAGSDIGERCQYETWSLHCGGSCGAGRCQGGPALAFSALVQSESGVRFGATPSGAIVFDDDVFVTFASDGRTLSRSTAATQYELPPLETADGGVIFSSRLGVARKVGGARPWQLELDVEPSINAGFALGRGTLYGTFDARLAAVDAASGALRSSVELPASVKSIPAVLANGGVAVSLGKELMVVDAAGQSPVRAALPTTIVGGPVAAPHGEALVATDDGKLWLVAGTSAKTLASVGKFIRRAPVLTPSGSALVVTSEKSYEGAVTLHAIALATGRELWRVKLDDVPDSLLVDVRGEIFAASAAGITAFGSDGKERWMLDLMGQGGYPPAALGPNGLIFFKSEHRFSALAAGAAAPYRVVPP